MLFFHYSVKFSEVLLQQEKQNKTEFEELRDSKVIQINGKFNTFKLCQ